MCFAHTLAEGSLSVAQSLNWGMRGMVCWELIKLIARLNHWYICLFNDLEGLCFIAYALRSKYRFRTLVAPSRHQLGATNRTETATDPWDSRSQSGDVVILVTLQPSAGCNPWWCRQASNRSDPPLMSGKILVGVVSAFFVAFFVFESWLMRGLPHWPVEKWHNFLRASQRLIELLLKDQ